MSDKRRKIPINEEQEEVEKEEEKQSEKEEVSENEKESDNQKESFEEVKEENNQKEEEEEEEKEETEKDYLKIENINAKKCSLKDHENIDAVNYCQNCNILMCNKCEKLHDELFKENHKKCLNQIYTGICEEKNHLMKLEYFCKTHNQLCCSSCLCKIKTNGNGKHKDCDTCSIKKIKNEKKKKLSENIKYLENISPTIEQSINEIKQFFQKINENKEN